MKKRRRTVPVLSINQAMLLGESVARQISLEKQYFHEKYGREPRTAVRSGSLCHSRGLVQLLSEYGYDSCLFYASDDNPDNLNSDTFEWIGFDGSSVIVKRNFSQNESEAIPDEMYFSPLEKSQVELPSVRGDLNHPAAGFFGPISTRERLLFNLEHKYYTAEKLLSLASISGSMSFPAGIMKEAMHEILSFQYYHFPMGDPAASSGNDTLSNIMSASVSIDKEAGRLTEMAGASFKKPTTGELTLMIINPHPFDVDTTAEVEIQLNETNSPASGSEGMILLNEIGNQVPAQYANTGTSGSAGNRKRIAFRAAVPSGSMTRYSAFFTDHPETFSPLGTGEDLIFSTERSKLVIDRISGSPSVFEFEGQKLLGNGHLIFSLSDGYSDPVFSSLTSPPRISEQGPVRTIAESLFSCGNSSIHVRYLIPVNGPYFDIEITVDRVDKDKILKWSIPVGYNMNCIARTISGISCCKHRKREYLFRDWLGMKNFEGDVSLSLCSNGAFTYDIIGNTVRISLSGAADGKPDPFRFRFLPGKTDDITDRSFNNSDLFNNPLITQQVFPAEAGSKPFSGIRISDSSVNLQSVRLNDAGDLVLRLLNPCKETKKFTIEVASPTLSAEIDIAPKKLKTIVVQISSGRFIETDLPDRVKT